MINTSYLNDFNSPIRQINGKVELIKGSTDTNSGEIIEYTYENNLKSIKIDKECEMGKFFGFGVSQKATVNLVDKNREINIVKGERLQPFFKINNNDYIDNLPKFYVEEPKRDENTNELTITAYDVLYATSTQKIGDVAFTYPTDYTIEMLCAAIASYLGLSFAYKGSEEIFKAIAPPNPFEGTETLRAVLDDVAEITQTIYYISGDTLTFRKLDKGAAADLTIGKQHYFTLKSKEVIKLGSICNTNELSNAVIHPPSAPNMTQYIRDNDFYSYYDDEEITTKLSEIDIYDIYAHPFECSWRGNFLLEIGDKLDITTKDDGNITAYYLNDSITYNGGFSQTTQWSETENKRETVENPSSLGSILKQTYAKVDKANQQIELVAKETEDSLSEITLTTEEIKSSVSSNKDYIDSTNEAINNLTKKVSSTITDEELEIAIQSALNDGVNKVETTTGFTFNEEGLTVSKSGSEISTTITEDGMTVAKNGSDVLTANNEGVKAIDLHATTYLLIGNNSRFEDYRSTRTACFWIGG